MAKIKLKFNLNFGGEEIRTLDDLRENFSVEDVLDNYNNGTLTRWLDSRSYNNELEQVKAIQATDTRGIFAELIHIFGTGSDPTEIEANISLIDYLEGRRKFWEERKTLEPLEQELEEVNLERDALKQELENAKKGQATQQELEIVKQERDALKQELEKAKKELETAKHGQNTLMQKTEEGKSIHDDKGIRAEIPVRGLRQNWILIRRAGLCMITDFGNCPLLNIKAKDEWAPFDRYGTLDEAVRNKTVFNGIYVRPGDQYQVYEQLNSREPLYFYYEEVQG